MVQFCELLGKLDVFTLITSFLLYYFLYLCKCRDFLSFLVNLQSVKCKFLSRCTLWCNFSCRKRKEFDFQNRKCNERYSQSIEFELWIRDFKEIWILRKFDFILNWSNKVFSVPVKISKGKIRKPKSRIDRKLEKSNSRMGQNLQWIEIPYDSEFRRAKSQKSWNLENTYF